MPTKGIYKYMLNANERFNKQKKLKRELAITKAETRRRF